jgi:hypothetical protein
LDNCLPIVLSAVVIFLFFCDKIYPCVCTFFFVFEGRKEGRKKAWQKEAERKDRSVFE